MNTSTTELDAFQRWVSEHGRIPRMSSLDPVELSHARWLNARHAEDRTGALDPGTAGELNSIPGAMPAGHRRSVTEWCTLVEGFMLDRGCLPSEAAADDFELSLARAIEKTIIPAMRRGPVSAFSPLQSSLRELQDRAVRPKRPAPVRKQNIPTPTEPEGQAANHEAFQHWLGEHGRIPRLSSLDPEELALARWLEAKRPEALAGTLDTETARSLRSIPGAVPAHSSRSIGEWCTMVEGFVLDRGALPSAASPDSFESSLARAVDDVVITVVRTGGSLLEHSALDVALPELRKHAVRLREAPFDRQLSLPKPGRTNTVHPRKPRLPKPVAVPGARAREHEKRRLDQMRAYVADAGFLPPSNSQLGSWAARRITAGDGPVAGVAIELLEIRSAYPGYARAGHLRWASTAADHVRAHGTLPEAADSRYQALRLEMLRSAVNSADIPPGPLAAIRTVLSAPPAPSPIEMKQQSEVQRLIELRAYIQKHGHLPARRSSLGWWSADRILEGSPAPGVVDELVRLKDDYPSHGQAKAIGWAQAAAAHHTEHGVLPALPRATISWRQDALRGLIEQYDLPGHLLPAIRLVLDEPDPYGKKWSAVFSGFTAWVNAHGKLPNRRSSDQEEYRLANWLNVQRVNQRAGTFRPDLAERLGAVQGALTPQVRIRPTRQTRIAQVMNFHAAAGRFPGRGSQDDAERKLGTWLNNQRRGIHEGRVTPADFGELANLPGALMPSPRGTQPRTGTESAARVVQFHALHAHLPRRSSGSAEERRLAAWLDNTRWAVRAGRISASDFGGLAEVPGALGDWSGAHPAS